MTNVIYEASYNFYPKMGNVLKLIINSLKKETSPDSREFL